MTDWDPHGMAQLERLRDQLTDIGLIEVVRVAVAEQWRINRDRHEPEAYDDATTLGLHSAKNLANRLLDEIPANAALRSAGVMTTSEWGYPIVVTPQAEVRIVKAPLSIGRAPRFESDFEWTTSDGRQRAAERNRGEYAPPSRVPGAEPLFEMPPPDAAEAAAKCRDVFIVWGAEFDSGLTAGWLGLPTTASASWIAVTEAWWDEPIGTGRPTSNEDVVIGHHDGFDTKTAPTPTIALRPQRHEQGNPG